MDHVRSLDHPLRFVTTPGGWNGDGPGRGGGQLKESGDKVVCIDFWDSWCGPCKVIGPPFEVCNYPWGVERGWARERGGPTEGEWGQGGVYRLLGFLVWTL